MKAITEKSLRERVRLAIKSLMSEDDIKNFDPPNMGIYDQPIGSLDSEEMKPEDPEDVPVGPSPEANMQLSKKIPDIENPEYVPGSVKELQSALHALGDRVPDDQVRAFYRDVVDALTRSIDKDHEESLTVKESLDLPHSYYKGEPAPGTASLQQTADRTGIGSVAKMAQFENRLLKKIKSLLVTSKGRHIEALLDASVEAYMQVMKEAGNMSQDDIDFFNKSPERLSQLKASDLFRQFIGQAILQEGMRRIRLDTQKAIESELETLDIPAGSDLTILNYVMGNTNLTYQKMLDLVGKKAAKSSFPDEKMFELSKMMPSILKRLKSKIEDLSNTKLIPLAIKQWIDASKAKKIKLLKKAAQSLSDTYDAEASV